MSTFENDRTLPSLPVPEPEDTCAQLKRLIRPLVSQSVMEETCGMLDSFFASEGRALQEKLLSFRASLFANESWLRPIWDDMYLSSRDRLPINTNYAFKFTRDGWSADNLPTVIAALARTIGRMWEGSLPPEETRDGFLSMDTLEYILYTRVPQNGRDIPLYPPRNSRMAAAVVCSGHWFILALTDEAGEFLSPAGISDALSQIRVKAAKMEAVPPLGAMTCANRENAAFIRSLLLKSPQNRMNLESLEKTVFTVALDKPGQEDFVLRLIAGDAQNRWHDKSFQLISDGNDLGANIEHSGCDAGIWAYLLGQADALLKAGIPVGSERVHIRALRWDLSNDTRLALEKEEAEYRALAGRLLFAKKRSEVISKDKIKAIKCSPDAFVQLLFQAAYYRLTGKIGSVYEAASTRNFYGGRTEAVRACSDSSAALARGIAEGAEKEVLKGLLQDAVKEHGERIKTAKCALGAERHMTGLYTMAQSNGNIPPVFSCEGYRTLRRDTLSTSNTTAPFIDFFGFGPVAPDGLGIGYGIKNEALHIAVCAYDKTNIEPMRFISEIENAAQLLFGLFDE